LEEKLRLFAQCGVEYAFLADFPSIRQLSPEQFVQKILIEKCHCISAVCGYNYRFGAFGKGDPTLLGKLLKSTVITQGEVRDDDGTVSSTRIRKLISTGDMENVARLLTHPYTLTSPVLHGKGLGKTWGIPTINQEFPQRKQIPAKGVYVTTCTIGGATYESISNVGTRPTVEQDSKVNCETYLLNFSGDLYGSTITTSFLKFLRSEEKFDSETALTQQIQSDIAQAQEYFQKNNS
jgi:riboflavin kinase/FMN adenylyltransferase